MTQKQIDALINYIDAAISCHSAREELVNQLINHDDD